ncbi:CsgG/HfaB family protein [Thiotrichales bacterium 19S9-12]|nr:CsgG/HfaB family protein [Thiotrichales bacterium 19S9-11]MCF6811464.1 CsgG/HfaB family protein [Thiotrichales bacterium 19S9-12]
MKRLSLNSIFLCLFTLVLGLFSANLYASPTLTTVTKDIEGSGSTLNLAIGNAIINGVGQVNGAYVKSVSAVIDQKSVDQGYVRIANQVYPVSADILSRDNLSAIQAATNGAVISYQVKDQKQLDNDQWQVTLTMTFAQYQAIEKSPEKQKQYSLAILPFQITPQAAKGPISPKRSQDLLNQALTDNLIKANRYRMIDRNHSDLKNYNQEVALLTSGNANKLDQARLSQLIGADLLLVGNIDQLKITTEKREFYGSTFDHHIAEATINFRLIEMATLAVLHSDTVTVDIPEDEINQILVDPDNNLQTVEQALITKTAKTISDNLLNYKIK